MKDRLIEIKLNMPGFDHFCGSWVCRGNLNIVIDVGPANSVIRLIDALTSIELNRVDYVLLTHIHIDHAGGLADFLNHYPMAKVICHEKAIKHLIDPSRLWAGSLKTLGNIAKAYGEPRSVPVEKLIPHQQIDLKDLAVIETPGHAIHHLSYCYNNRLFAGEACGNYFIINNSEYIRPATPHKFYYDVCIDSVDRLLTLEDQPIRFAHFGEADSSHRMLKKFRDQLVQWKNLIYQQVVKGNKDLEKRCMDSLFKNDANLTLFNKMDSDTREREKFFIANSIKGFVEYLREM